MNNDAGFRQLTEAEYDEYKREAETRPPFCSKKPKGYRSCPLTHAISRVAVHGHGDEYAPDQATIDALRAIVSTAAFHLEMFQEGKRNRAALAKRIAKVKEWLAKLPE